MTPEEVIAETAKMLRRYGCAAVAGELLVDFTDEQVEQLKNLVPVTETSVALHWLDRRWVPSFLQEAREPWEAERTERYEESTLDTPAPEDRIHFFVDMALDGTINRYVNEDGFDRESFKGDCSATWVGGIQ